MNELVSNCLKHAFPEGSKGEIRISLRSLGEKEFELVISDNGVGIQKDPDLESSRSLGLRLVEAFVRQLDGKTEVIVANDTEVRLRFLEKHERSVPA